MRPGRQCCQGFEDPGEAVTLTMVVDVVVVIWNEYHVEGCFQGGLESEYNMARRAKKRMDIGGRERLTIGTACPRMESCWLFIFPSGRSSGLMRSAGSHERLRPHRKPVRLTNHCSGTGLIHSNLERVIVNRNME